MKAKALRAQARTALRGKWGTAVAVCLVANLLTDGIGSISSASNAADNGMLQLNDARIFAFTATMALVWSLVVIVIGGAVELGKSRFMLKLLRKERARFSDLFSCFDQLGRGFCMQFLMGLFVLLWSLLLIVPGIIAGFSYAMTPYLMAEFPNLSVMDALRESKRLMRGNRMRLFCLSFSFLGWEILALFTLGIGYLWLIPYMQASTAAFYLDITGRSNAEPDCSGQRPETIRGPEF